MKGNYENPFYDNHIFSKYDLQRCVIKWWQYPALWFRTTYVQINDGYVFYFKYGRDGAIYLMKVEEENNVKW